MQPGRLHFLNGTWWINIGVVATSFCRRGGFYPPRVKYSCVTICKTFYFFSWSTFVIFNIYL